MNALGIVRFVFLLIGIGLLTGAYFMYHSTSEFVRVASKAQGTVVQLARSRSSDSTTYAPVVRYRTEGGREVEFVSNVSSDPPAYSVGEKVEVLYRPEQPEKGEINSIFQLWFGPMLLGGLGSAFFVIGTVVVLASRRKAGADSRLKLHGRAIQTDFQSVERDTGYSENGRHPCVVVTQWKNPATGEVHVFRSDHLWYDPTDHIKTDRITVYIERDNPGKYFMDVGFLPRLASNR